MIFLDETFVLKFADVNFIVCSFAALRVRVPGSINVVVAFVALLKLEPLEVAIKFGHSCFMSKMFPRLDIFYLQSI